MAQLEENFLSNQPLLPKIWLRYIDDIFIIWNHSREALNIFLEDLNEFHKTIKFTYESSPESVNFLDITVYLKNGNLHHKLYTKPTDSHLYLRFDSCHPIHNKKSIPYSQMIRLKRIHNNNEEYETAVASLMKNLEKRHYPRKLLQEIYDKAKRTPPN